MSGPQSAAQARHAAHRPERGPQATDLSSEAQVRAQYLKRAGGGLVVVLLGSVTKPVEVRTRNGAPWLIFIVVPDGDRSADEAPTTTRVEFLGDVEALAAQLTKGAAVYCEGRLTLSTWVGRDGVERTGLRVEATHVEVLE